MSAKANSKTNSLAEKLRIGISCYPTYGGSGIVATELGLELARRGHEAHFICSDAPRRYPTHAANVFLHEVKAPAYPLFRGDNQYALALTSKMVEAAQDAHLDILHVHYAIPHAVAGVLARQILGKRAPKLVTTLHGTDITVVGGDPSFLPVTRFAIEESDAVTTPSRYLREATYEKLGIDRSKAIQVIPNFVDTLAYEPLETLYKHVDKQAYIQPRPIIVHNSNFRPLKRLGDVIRIFAAVRKTHDCELHLIGDGPDRAMAEALAEELGVADSVTFHGERLDFIPLLQSARVFLLPSESESFGLAALEALSCGVPVVASNAGGLPELIAHGENGMLADIGDVDSMARSTARLLEDDAFHARLARNARAQVLERYPIGPVVAKYIDCYKTTLA